MLKNIATYEGIQRFKDTVESNDAEVIIRHLFGVTRESAAKILKAGFPMFSGCDLAHIVIQRPPYGQEAPEILKVEVTGDNGGYVEIPLLWSLNEGAIPHSTDVWEKTLLLTARELY